MFSWVWYPALKMLQLLHRRHLPRLDRPRCRHLQSPLSLVKAL